MNPSVFTFLMHFKICCRCISSEVLGGGPCVLGHKTPVISESSVSLGGQMFQACLGFSHLRPGVSLVAQKTRVTLRGRCYSEAITRPPRSLEKRWQNLQARSGQDARHCPAQCFCTGSRGPLHLLPNALCVCPYQCLLDKQVEFLLHPGSPRGLSALLYLSALPPTACHVPPPSLLST